LQVYREQTSPLVDFYRSGGRLKEVKGTGSPDEVYAELSAAVAR